MITVRLNEISRSIIGIINIFCAQKSLYDIGKNV